jgi:hypothetical protein
MERWRNPGSSFPHSATVPVKVEPLDYGLTARSPDGALAKSGIAVPAFRKRFMRATVPALKQRAGGSRLWTKIPVLPV